MSDFILRVLRVIEQADMHDELFWRVKPDGAVTFFLNVNDVFWWACADTEEITPDNISLLEASVAECAKFGHSRFWQSALFAARVRGMRPQGAAYPEGPPELRALLDACGPERSVGPSDPGNTSKTPEKP